MNLDVLCQVVGLIKLQPTKVALALVALILMGAHVIGQVTTTGKRLPTINTFVWFLSSVGPNMDSQVARMQERLPTIVAFVQLLTCRVRLDMCSQVRINDECLTAETTFIRFIASMCTNMNRQVAVDGKCLATIFAFVWFIPTMSSFMLR